MTEYNFAINPESYGLPTRTELVDMRIWDLHYHGLRNHEDVMEYVERMGVERVFSLDVAGLAGMTPEEARENARENLALIEEQKDRVSGLVRIDPTRVDASLEHIENMIANGPCVGIKTGTRHGEPITVAHPNYDPIISRLAELEAVIYIHSGFMVGGEPRTYYGGTRTGEAHPGHVAELAARFPKVPLICGHQGADWELGVRAIRPHENVYMEFSGMDPESGAIDFAVQELGADRIVWGGHLPSRSYSNELSKIFDGDLTDEERRKIFGTNLRRLAAPIMQKKGYQVEI